MRTEAVGLCFAADRRDGICTETSLLRSWPEGGPKLLWEIAGLGKGYSSLAIIDGRFLWGYNKIANGTANISTPVVHGEYVFCSTAYSTGSALLKLTAAADSVNAEEVYFLNARTFQNHHGGFVRIGDYIYGGHDHNKGKPTCIEMKTGKVV